MIIVHNTPDTQDAKNIIKSINNKVLKHDAEKLLKLLGYSEFDLGILITTDKEIQRYNKQFRKIDKPTDILSFPYLEQDLEQEKTKKLMGDEKNLGDIIISAERAAHDAQELGLSLELRLRVLLVHGICHLLGYDHQTDTDYNRMNAQEQELLDKLN